MNWLEMYRNPKSFTRQECENGWLAQHGDRTDVDVLHDEKGDYVFMGDYQGDEVIKIYLPLYK